MVLNFCAEPILQGLFLIQLTTLNLPDLGEYTNRKPQETIGRFGNTYEAKVIPRLQLDNFDLIVYSNFFRAKMI